MIRVAVVDDQTLVRAGFRMICEAEDDLNVVGEAADGADAVAMVARADAHRLPAVVLWGDRHCSRSALAQIVTLKLQVGRSSQSTDTLLS